MTTQTTKASTTKQQNKASYIDDDLVKRNEILKAQVFLEDKALRDWKTKWGFLLDFDKMLLEEASKKGYTEEEFKRISGFRKDKKKCTEEPIWKPIPVPVPRTSSGLVGWRSQAEHSLEKLGPLHVNPVSTLPPRQLVWNIKLG